MDRRVNATQTRLCFGKLVRQAAEGETIIVERYGEPLVVMLSIDAYQRLVEGRHQEPWQDKVDRARAQIRIDLAGRDLPSPDEILAQIREERTACLTNLR